MKITFLAVGTEQLGISLLAAVARRMGHEVGLAFSVSLFNDRSHLTFPPLARFFDDTPVVLETIRKQRPDVLVCSPLSGAFQWVNEVAREAKKRDPGMKVLFGGVHTTAVPDHVLAQPHVDYICVGEGDEAFPLILQAIARGGPSGPIVNTRFKLPDGRVVRGPQAGFFQDLDALPGFDKTIWEDYIPLHDSYLTMASRGCPYRCTYCFNSFYADLPECASGPYLRYRSPGHVLQELRGAKARYRFRVLEFFDDVFTLNKKWLKEFLPAYKKEIGVQFQIFTHIRFIDDETCRWLADSGCLSAQIGVQTLDEEYKRKYLKRDESTRQIETALRLLRTYRIRAKFDHMFGLPGEPVDAQAQARKFYAEHTPYRVQTYWLNYFPGTRMYRDLITAGDVTPEDREKMARGEVYDSFTRSNGFIDAEKLKTYKIHETLFKLLPVLPAPLRKGVGPQALAWLPTDVCSFLTLVIDIASGFLRWDIDHLCYARYYIYHIYRFMLVEAGRNPPPATRLTGGEARVPAAETAVSRT